MVGSDREPSHKPYEISVYDVMGAIKLRWRPMLVLAYGALTYSQFICQIMFVTFGQDSLWKHWPHLATQRVQFNGCIAGQSFARLAGNLFISPLLDHYGRRSLLMACNILSLLTTIGATFAGNFAVYATFRCLSILFAAPAGMSAFPYVIELTNPSWRKYVTMANHVGACLGIMYLILVKWLLERNNSSVWNWLQLYGHIPTVIGLIFGFITFYESPGYSLLYKNGGAKKAWHVIDKMAGKNRVDEHLAKMKSEDDSAEPFHEGTLTRSNVKFKEESLHEKHAKPSLKEILDVRKIVSSWFSLFKGKALLRDTTGMVIIWFGSAFCHWGILSYCTLFYETVGYDPNFMTLLSYIIQTPLHIVIMEITRKWKKEKAIVGWMSVAAALITFPLAAIVNVDSVPSILVAILAVTAVVLGAVIWGPVYSFSTERYPIAMRASAMGLFSAVSAISSVASTYLSSVFIMPGRIQYLLYVSGALRVVVLITSFWFIKTTIDKKLFDFEDNEKKGSQVSQA